MQREPQTTLRLPNGKGQLELEPVISARVPLVYDDIIDHLVEICRLNFDRFTPEDVYVELLAKRYQLWLVRRGRRIVMVGVTTIKIYPACKACTVIGISGSELEAWLQFEPDLLHWARAHGCRGVDVIGRRGWLKRLKGGWQEVGVMMTRAIEPEGNGHG